MELQAAIEKEPIKYVVSFTAPSSYWYLKHFDLTAMMDYVDWVNVMTYDLHGEWDRDNPIGSQILAHTNLTEIDLALDLFWRNSVDPSKVNMGLGFYGRSFELADTKCWKPGCKFSGGGKKGAVSIMRSGMANGNDRLTYPIVHGQLRNTFIQGNYSDYQIQ